MVINWSSQDDSSYVCHNVKVMVCILFNSYSASAKHSLLILSGFFIFCFSAPTVFSAPTGIGFSALKVKLMVLWSRNLVHGCMWMMSGSNWNVKVIGQRPRSGSQKKCLHGTLPGLNWLNTDRTICPACIQIEPCL